MIPAVLELGNENMKGRHWERLFTGMNQKYSGMNFSLQVTFNFHVGMIDAVCVGVVCSVLW